MPYISSAEVKVKRTLLRKTFKTKDGWKLSVRGENYSSINVSILSAPIDLLKGSESTYEQVNHFYIKDHYSKQPKVRDVLLKVYDIINSDNGVLVEDSDYGTVPSFYTSISIGSWDKPFIVKK